MLKQLFNLENEENLILDDRITKNIGTKGKSTILYGQIVQSNNKCSCCDSKNIVKNGTYKSTVLFNKINNERILLKLSKQRYICRNCKTNFIPAVTFLEKRKRISNQILNQVSIDTTLTLSNKQISRQNFVSANTVERNLKKFKSYLTVNKNSLSKVICVDEFKGVKNYKNKMNFIIVDGYKHKVKDVLINRQKNTLEKYFLSYSKKAKYKVEYFVSDMYDTYISLAKKQFPNAKIIIDRFHTKRLIINSLKNKRINIMKKHSKYTYQYRVLKNFRDVLLKDYEEVSIKYEKIKYYEMFKSEYEILMYMLSLDEQLENMYWIYQEFLKAFDNRDVDKFKTITHKEHINISEEMKQVFRTYRKYEEYIINSLIYPYSNGVVEGINNKIKLIKRISYGYRNFENFRLKILLAFNFIKDNEDIETRDRKILYLNTS